MTNEQNNLTETVSFEDLQKAFSFSTSPEEDTEEPELEFPGLDLTPKEEDIKEDPILQQKEEDKPSTPEPKKDNFYLNLLKRKLEKDLWEDVIIKEGDKEVKLSEMEDLTEEEFFKLEEDQLALKNEDVKEKYISVDGLPEDRKKILEIVKNGGDLTELFQPNELQKPFDEKIGWDLENEKHLEKIVYEHYLSVGNSPSRAELLLKEDQKEFIVDTKAKQIVDFHRKVYNDKLDSINRSLVEEKKTEEENIKKFRSELTKTYKDSKVPDHDIKKLVDLDTKEVDGEYGVDQLFEKIMKDPKEASELLFFMAEKEKYLQQKMLSNTVKNNVSTMRTINRIPKSAPEKIKEEQQEDSVFKFNIGDIPK